MTAPMTPTAEEASRRELAAAEAERAAFVAWQEAYGCWEVAHAEYAEALELSR